jgi:hypothetical protein
MLVARGARDTEMASPLLQTPIFSPEIVSVAEVNVNFDYAQWVISTSWDNSIEGIVYWLQELKGNIHCPQSPCVD